jgi:phosphatidylglycerol---prolipoprotein diacylglyceryl transferase
MPHPPWHDDGVHPVLFTAFGEPVHAYSAATITGYALGVAIGLYLARRDGRDVRDMLELGVVIVLSAVLGAKVFHFLFESKGHDLGDGRIADGMIDVFLVDPWHWARLFEPGYVFYGGVVFAIGMAYVFVVRRGLQDKGSIGDYAAPGFALGVAIGRMGCFLGGCCYGAPTDLPWAVRFPASHETHGIAVHPVQLYDVAFGLVALALIAWRWPKRRFGGEIFAALIAGYAIWRFGTEMFRADADRGVWAGGHLSTSQIVSLVVLPTTLFFWRRASQLARHGALRDPRVKLDEASPRPA